MSEILLFSPKKKYNTGWKNSSKYPKSSERHVRPTRTRKLFALNHSVWAIWRVQICVASLACLNFKEVQAVLKLALEYGPWEPEETQGISILYITKQVLFQCNAVGSFSQLELNLLENTVRASPGICTIANANFADNVASFARNKKLQSLQGRSVKLREREREIYVKRVILCSLPPFF